MAEKGVVYVYILTLYGAVVRDIQDIFIRIQTCMEHHEDRALRGNHPDHSVWYRRRSCIYICTGYSDRSSHSGSDRDLQR